MGMMAALTYVLALLDIPIGESVKFFTVAYLPGTVVASILGPWAALVFGIVADTVGYIAKPQAAYFPGYILSNMITCFIHAIFLYKKNITILSVAVARISVVIVVLLGMNYIWSTKLWGAVAATYFTRTRLVNNLIQFPIHVGLTYAICRLGRKTYARIHGSVNP